MTAYIAFLHPPEDGSTWGVTFPDVPCCISVGDSFEEAAEAAREALSGHLAALRADGDPMPAPRSWQALKQDAEAMADARGAHIHLVTPRLIPSERVRVNITIDKGLLRLADEAAEARGLTRSGLIESVLAAVVEA